MITATHPIDAEERVIIGFSTHWMKYAWPTAIYILFVALLTPLFLLTLEYFTKNGVWLTIHSALLVCIFLVHHWYFHKLLSEAMMDVVITNKRIIYLEDSLLLYDNMREFKLRSIPAVQARKEGLLQNIFRYGTLTFDTGGSSSEDSGCVIHRVPHPHRVAKEITSVLEMK